MSPTSVGPVQEFDTSAAITRSMLGWGVVAGPFYVVVGIVLAATRPGFDITQHALSLLELGEHGWMQRANLTVTALMVAVAAAGILRTVRGGRGLAMGSLVGVYAASLFAAAVFVPDAVEGFPPGEAGGQATTSGILHLAAGALGFMALGVAAIAYSRWARSIGDRPRSLVGLLLGLDVIVGFMAGAALAQSVIGVALIWLAVLAGFAWLALASAHLYTVVPHPAISQRGEGANPTR